LARSRITLLDGAVGTELGARGVETPAPLWSAAAVERAPEVLASIHRDYAAAGATVHTAATFRTTRRAAGERWRELAVRAVAIARAAVPPGHRVAGSIAPLEDCYRPDLSPPAPRPEHRALAEALAEAGVDLLLCETFAHPGEALVAVEEAVRTGLPTWASFTAGPSAELLTPEELTEAARRAVGAGAQAVLVNCVPASRTAELVARLAHLGVPVGAYANAGAPAEGMGWVDAPPGALGDGDMPARAAERSAAASAYAERARTWLAAGATIVGGCCGTSPAHVAALRRIVTKRALRG
jgi:S-methylmethionine-dependent homocysteine/selenocysteine methylase